MKIFYTISMFCISLLFNITVQAYPPLQLYIALTPENGVLRPEPGRYSGPVTITKPITIDGRGEVILDNEGDGTVINIQSDGVTIRGLQITGSGKSFDKVDAGILLEADKAVIENNIIVDTLFGINLKSANGNVIKNNHISSYPEEIGLRGEGIRVWNSFDNVIDGNVITKVRDMFIINSSDNHIINNKISKSRVAIQLVLSHGNEIIGNELVDNKTGILLYYSNNLIIKKNKIAHLRSIAGAALAFKESNGVVVSENEILNCAVGITANAPVHPENYLTVINNRFAYNDVALYFYGEKGGHIINGNRFEQNMIDVRVSAVTTALANDWKGNYWDTYRGFDLNNDMVGDTPHELYIYSDRIWMDRPMTQFFRGSPAMEFLDFAERLTTYSEPAMLLRDPSPKVQ